MWNEFFESDVKMWVKWHEYWLDLIETHKLPVFFFRFEDLLLNPEPILKNMFRYVLGKEDLEGTVI